MPSARHDKFAGCNAHEDKKIISMPLLKMCVPKRRAKQVPTAPVRLNEAMLLSSCIARPSPKLFWGSVKSEANVWKVDITRQNSKP